MTARSSRHIVVMAVGIRPNADLAKEAGLAVNRGIVVDAGMRPPIPTSSRSANAPRSGQVYGLVAPLYEMAGVAARSGSATAPSFHSSDTRPNSRSPASTSFRLGDFRRGRRP
jgi:nitrite reductase (NADH) large subunit